MTEVSPVDGRAGDGTPTGGLPTGADHEAGGGDRVPDRFDDGPSQLEVSEAKLARIALGCLVEPGNRELGLMLRHEGAVRALELVVTGRLASGRLAGAVGARLDDRRLPRTVDAARELAVETVLRAHRLGARLVTPDDAEWPRQLNDLVLVSREGQEPVRRDTDPPVCLWVRGDPPLDEALARSVAIVGSRAATSYGNTIAAELAYGLAGRDWTIVSGGAFGIDAQAHRAAIAAGGLTVAVLACGIDTPYPAAHAVLFEQIAEDGLLVTEWPPGSEPFKTRFLTRNRCIAAATRGTVMVEAGARSGARNTLTHARRLGRAAMVVPGPITSAMSVGCHVELRRSDTVLVTSVEEVIEEIGAIGDLATVPTSPTTRTDLLSPTEQRLLDAVSPRKLMTAEEIAANAGTSGTEARRALPGLEAAGFVVSTEEGRYRLPPRKATGATPDG